MDFFCKVEKAKVTLKEKEKIFYVDKYRPKKAEDFIIHSSIIQKLSNLLNLKENDDSFLDIMNLFLYGPADSGKYCLARFYIENYFQDPCILSEKTFVFESKELIYYKSNYHFELIVDSHNCNIINLIKNFLEEIVRPINSKSFNKYKNVIMIKNINFLKNEVLHLLKYYLDKHYNNVFILIGNNNIKEIKSFFTNMRIPKPGEDEMTKHLKKIIKQEGLKVKKKELSYIINKGERSIFKTICLLENCYISGVFEEYYDSNDKLIGYIYNLIRKPSIKGMIQIRENLNQLLVSNMSLKEIIYLIDNKIRKDKKIKDADKITCSHYLIDCEHNFKRGYREIHHLEYCFIRIANFMKNKWIESKSI